MYFHNICNLLRVIFIALCNFLKIASCAKHGRLHLNASSKAIFCSSFDREHLLTAPLRGAGVHGFLPIVVPAKVGAKMHLIWMHFLCFWKYRWITRQPHPSLSVCVRAFLALMQVCNLQNAVEITIAVKNTFLHTFLLFFSLKKPTNKS